MDPGPRSQSPSPGPAPEKHPGLAILSDLYFVLHQIRFVLVVVGPVVLALLLTDQGHELFRAVGQGQLVHSLWLRITCLLGATLLLALHTWYFSRVALMYGRPGEPPSDRIRSLATWVPRLLGTGIIVLLALGFVWVAFLPGTEGESRPQLFGFAALWLGAAAGFLSYVIFRRRLRVGPGKAPSAVPVGLYARHRDLEPLTRLALAALVGLDLVVAALFTWGASRLAPSAGAITVALTASALWMTLVGVLTRLGSQLRLPLLLGTALGVAGFSFFNDNHAVATLPRPVPVRDAIGARFKAWLCDLTTRERQPTVYLVATEGGGIRAAYWTAAVLGRIEDEHPGFGRHTFAISSVSGGSLGAGVFAAMLADLRDGFPAPPKLKERASDILSHDFLSPVLAKMLYPDLAQRLLPVSIPAFDRASALEDSWAQAWKRHASNDRFREPFTDLWEKPGANDPGRHAVPLLLLNAASVEGGNRFLVAPVTGGSVFEDSTDGLSVIGSEVSLVTALHLSARFPYVSPAARVSSEGKLWGHVVDGGYFENSGAATALDVLDVMRQPTDCGPFKLAVVVIQYRQDDDRDDAPSTSCCTAARTPAPLTLLPDLLAPPLTLINTRDARARYAMATLLDRTRVGDGLPICLVLHQGPDDLQLPLGWRLSRAARDLLDRKLAHLDLTPFQNPPPPPGPCPGH